MFVHIIPSAPCKYSKYLYTSRNTTEKKKKKRRIKSLVHIDYIAVLFLKMK